MAGRQRQDRFAAESAYCLLMTDMSDNPLTIEQQKCLHEAMRQYAHRAHDRMLDFSHKANGAAIAGGNLALKMLVVINGGAAVSLLTFIGSLPAIQQNATAGALIWFALGVASGALGFTFAYFTTTSPAKAVSVSFRFGNTLTLCPVLQLLDTKR
jgi:hypothetical protein